MVLHTEKAIYTFINSMGNKTVIKIKESYLLCLKKSLHHYQKILHSDYVLTENAESRTTFIINQDIEIKCC